MTTAYLFPGQGSQAIGMAQALCAAFPEARAVLQEVDDALSYKLSAIMAAGPEAELTRTENTQPAIMAASMAAFAVMQAHMGVSLPASAGFVAGHSLGEYSALTAAGTFALADAARLLQIRGQAMQAAVPEGQGLMAAIIGPEIDAVREIVARAQKESGAVVEVANHNAPNQIVISGSKAGVELAMQLAKDAGAKRAVALSVSAPFHCSLMQPAAGRMEEALAAVTLQPPAVPVVANVTAKPTRDVNEVRSLLVQQVTGMVRFVDTVEFFKTAGVRKIVEIGHGLVLTGLIKRMAPEIALYNIAAPEDLDLLAKAA
jgi:[acyl-carrier-protein] S-malonyltransferase